MVLCHAAGCHPHQVAPWQWAELFCTQPGCQDYRYGCWLAGLASREGERSGWCGFWSGRLVGWSGLWGKNSVASCWFSSCLPCPHVRLLLLLPHLSFLTAHLLPHFDNPCPSWVCCGECFLRRNLYARKTTLEIFPKLSLVAGGVNSHNLSPIGDNILMVPWRAWGEPVAGCNRLGVTPWRAWGQPLRSFVTTRAAITKAASMIIRVRLPARSGHISKITTPKIINGSGNHKSLFFTFAAQFIPPGAAQFCDFCAELVHLAGQFGELIGLGGHL